MDRTFLCLCLPAALMAGIAGAGAQPPPASPAPIRVRDADGLRRAVARAKPGTRITLAPGAYPGGFFFANLRGKPGRPIVLAGANPAAPPVIEGGSEGMHLSDPAWVELHDLTFRGATGNGLNIDDGGSYASPAHHLLLRRIRVQDVGPRGNHDGIKLSGVDDFRIENCTLQSIGGQGVDMVGCHRGAIADSTFRRFPEDASGVQAKGGSADIVVRRCRFEDAGSRAVNAGGSTGLAFFRPPLKGDGTPRAEAKDIRIEGCTFVGSDTPVAFVGVDGAIFRFNTVYRPRRWALRILQETREPGFVPCRNGVFTDNLIAFRSNEWFENGVNVGPGTAPETFVFARNFWYCLDAPARSRPAPPTSERNGVYEVDPQFRDPERGDLRPRSGSPAAKYGATAFAR
jgi:hypothetical protein